jgi:hypothetical protein
LGTAAISSKILVASRQKETEKNLKLYWREITVQRKLTRSERKVGERERERLGHAEAQLHGSPPPSFRPFFAFAGDTNERSSAALHHMKFHER